MTILRRIREWRVVKVIAGIAMRIWAASFAAVIIFFILYYFFGGILAIAMLIFAVSGILYHAQDNLLYHPELPAHSRVFVPLPTMYHLPYESVHIRSGSSLLHAFWIHHPPERSVHVPTIVYFHGNAGNMGHRLQNAFGFYHTLQCNVLLVDYRGYGLSTGEASESGLYSDGRAAVDYLQTRHDLDLSQIILFGRSLGGAVAIDVAADPVYGQRIMCVIVENTFTSIPDMAVELIHPSVKYLPLVCYKNQFMTISKIHFMSAPCLFVSGLADALVPPRMMSMLHSRCGSIHKQILQISGGSHNDTWAVNGYYPGLKKFIAECREFKGPMMVAPTLSHDSMLINCKSPLLQDV